MKKTDNNNLYERLENAARETGWHLWMTETTHALRHADIYRFGTWAELERLSKNIPAMQWLIARLDSFHINPSPVSPVEAAFYILACYCPDNKVLGYVVDTFMYYCKVQDSRGMLSCARIHAAIDREDEYPHLNVLYNLMTGTFLKEFDRFLCPKQNGGSFMSESDFREAERYLPDFKASGFREMVLARATTQMTGEELAKRCHMSNTAFRTHFKKAFGMTVADWLREQKKKKILENILHTDLPISKISERNGFRNESTFSEYCRRNFNAPPTKLREKHRNDRKLK